MEILSVFGGFCLKLKPFNFYTKVSFYKIGFFPDPRSLKLNQRTHCSRCF